MRFYDDYSCDYSCDYSPRSVVIFTATARRPLIGLLVFCSHFPDFLLQTVVIFRPVCSRFSPPLPAPSILNTLEASLIAVWPDPARVRACFPSGQSGKDAADLS